MELADYYGILGVLPSASNEDIRLTYRQAARLFHPDVNRAPGASALFRDINTAYEVLSSPASRADYDRLACDLGLDTPNIHMDVVYSRRHLKPLDEPQMVYALLRVRSLQDIGLVTDAPLNICLVIDRSTSMQGSRMHHVKAAAHRLIDELHEDDIVSVVSFSDNAEVLIPAQCAEDQRGMKSVISTLRAAGATAMYSGLQDGIAQVRRRLNTNYVNHVVLITDGRTYGDEKACLNLAAEAREQGIGISGLGIGDDWNDRFLDNLAKQTGGSSAYISTPQSVSSFLQKRIRSLATAFAERSSLIIAPAPNTNLESAIRTAPDPMSMDTSIQPCPLGSLDGQVGLAVVIQFHVTTGSDAVNGEIPIGRVDLTAEVLGQSRRIERVARMLTVEISPTPPPEDPPIELLDVLGKLSLYQLQDRAREALDGGDYVEATRKLEYLATRLFESGEQQLGNAALSEAQRVAHTHLLSEEGAKELKYGTRALLPPLGDKDD
nr:VWA domain-containing protein [Anaerolineae bacterium]